MTAVTAPCSPELLAALRLVRDGGTIPEGEVPDGIGLAFLTYDCLSSAGEVLLATAEALEVERLRSAYWKAKDCLNETFHVDGGACAAYSHALDVVDLAEAALRAAGGEP